MILEMQKVFLAAQQSSQAKVLRSIRKLGVIEPVPVASQPIDEALLARLDQAKRAADSIAQVQPQGEAPAFESREALLAELSDIQRKESEAKNKLASLARQVEQIEVWGDTQLDDLAALDKAGINPRFFLTPTLPSQEGIFVLQQLPKNVLCVAVGEAELPEGAQLIERPLRDRRTLLKEADAIDQKLKAMKARLAALAHHKGEVAAAVAELNEEVQIERVRKGALLDPDLFAMQGWIPTVKIEALKKGLEADGLTVALAFDAPAPDDDPPTCVRYSWWNRPIKGLFDILGTVPGYRELDLSPFFMIAMPIFAAMLIGDAGYGLLCILACSVFHRKATQFMGKDMTNLVLIFGITTFIWGILSANIFGVQPENLAIWSGFAVGEGAGNVTAMVEQGQGLWADIGRVMVKLSPLYPIGADGRPDGEFSRNLVMMVSFIMGSVHLVLAQLLQTWANRKHIKCLVSLGYAIFLFAMLGVIWMLFFPESQWMPRGLMYGMLIAGAVLIIFFSNRNPLIGLLSNILSMISTFSDSMSYIRLMAVGMAGYYIAMAFNQLAGSITDAANVAVALPVLLFGHLLNLCLCAISIFAHGVRLNMLEFSNNSGVQWAGHAYAPFAQEADAHEAE